MDNVQRWRNMLTQSQPTSVYRFMGWHYCYIFSYAYAMMDEPDVDYGYWFH
jgi:hypothetical protein